MNFKKFWSSLVQLAQGEMTQAQLSAMTDKELIAQVEFDNKGGRPVTQYSAEYARRQMSDSDLLGHINADAADGYINTPHSREYDRRRAARNARAVAEA